MRSNTSPLRQAHWPFATFGQRLAALTSWRSSECLSS